MNELIKTINSLEVAEMVNKDHNNVMKDIRRIIEQLGEVKTYQSYFIESSYKNSQNKELPCYLLTKKGCELFATRMTGVKGTRFAVEYIERFNEMERQLTETQLPMSNTELLLETALKHERELGVITERVDKLETETTLTASQRHKLRGRTLATVISVLGGKKANAYKNNSIRSTAYRNCYKEIQDVFDVASYVDIPKIRYQEALTLIPKWQPSLELQARIEEANGSSRLFEVVR